MNTINEFNTLIDTYNHHRNQFVKAATNQLRATFSGIFDQLPDLRAVSWLQYTPYFNDGDECVFSVHSPQFTNATPENINAWGEIVNDSPELWVVDTEYMNKLDNVPPAVIPVATAVGNIITNREMREVLKDMFGDHVRVIVTRNGIDVYDFDHD